MGEPKSQLVRRSSLSAGGSPQDEDGENDTAIFYAAAARAFLIGKLVLLPKFKLKAAAMFQPEDHASKIAESIRGGRLGWLRTSALNYGGIYLSGVLLFMGHATVLRRLKADETELDDEDTAHASKSALAGACGGIAYGLSSTPLISLLRLGGPARGELFSWVHRAVLRPLSYTLPRDAGGFALYFGVYSYVRTHPLITSSPAVEVKAEAEAEAKAETPPASSALMTVAAEAVPELATALVAGTAAGIATYLWRSPWDTLYKVRMGWRPPDAPLLSGSRFITSPRGAKAVGISGATWVVYEAVILAVRELTARGILKEPPQNDKQG